MQAYGDKNILYDFLLEPKFRIGRHILFMTILVFVALGQSYFVFGKVADALGSKIYWFAASLVVTYVVFAYVNLYYLAPRFLLKNKFVEYFFVFIASIAAFMAGKYIVESYMLSTIGIVRYFNEITLLDNVSNLTMNSICMGGSLLAVLLKQWINDKKQIDTLQNQQLKSSIEEIKARITPDFLYSTIAFAADEVKNDPSKASEVLFKLSELLRYELYDCAREKVILKSDIEFINSYLFLEQQKSKNNFDYSISTIGNTGRFISPFVFMPIIQEIMKRKPQQLAIFFDVENNQVEFECEVGFELTECGFEKITRRLSKLFVNNYLFLQESGSIKLQLKNV